MIVEGLFIAQGARFDSLQTDMTLEETYLWQNSVPDYPVEVGSPINSHITPRAKQYRVKALITRTPISYDRIAKGEANYSSAFSALEQIFNQGIIFVVQLRHGSFQNLAVKTVTIRETPKTENHIEFDLELKQFNWTATAFSSDFQAPTEPPPAHATSFLDVGPQ